MSRLVATGPRMEQNVDWSADGRWLAFADAKQVRIHETQNYTLERTIPQPEVLWLQFSPDSTQLLCTSRYGPGTTGTTAYDTRTWVPVAADTTLVAGGGVGVHSKWLSDSKQVVSHKRSTAWFSHAVKSTATASADGSRLATGSDFFNSNGYYGDLLIRIWDGASGRLVNDFHLDRPYQVPYNLSWQPGSTLIAAHIRRDGTHAEALRLLDSASGKTAQTLEGHTGKIWNTTWSPDGKQLASVGEDATCRLWDAETGQEIAAFRHTKGTVLADVEC